MLRVVLQNELDESSGNDDENKPPRKKLKSDSIQISQRRADEARRFGEFLKSMKLDIGCGLGKDLWAIATEAKSSMWDPKDCNLECLEQISPIEIKQQCVQAVAYTMLATARLIDTNEQICRWIINPEIKAFFSLFHITLTTHLEFMNFIYSGYVTDYSKRSKIIVSLKGNVLVKETLDQIRITTREPLPNHLFKLLLAVRISYSSFTLMSMQVLGCQKGYLYIKNDLEIFEKYVSKLIRILITRPPSSDIRILKEKIVDVQKRFLKSSFPDLIQRHNVDIEFVVTEEANKVFGLCYEKMEQEDDADEFHEQNENIMPLEASNNAEVFHEQNENIMPLEASNNADEFHEQNENIMQLEANNNAEVFHEQNENIMPMEANNQRGAAVNPRRRDISFTPLQLGILEAEFADSGKKFTCPPDELAILIGADQSKVSSWWHKKRHKSHFTPHNPRGRANRPGRPERP